MDAENVARTESPGRTEMGRTVELAENADVADLKGVSPDTVKRLPAVVSTAGVLVEADNHWDVYVFDWRVCDRPSERRAEAAASEEYGNFEELTPGQELRDLVLWPGKAIHWSGRMAGAFV